MARQEFVDVTLVCDDQNQIRAHKVILSACSDFFRNILLRNAAVSQPFIFLDNVSFQDLENVISFMYNGETAIGQEDFSSFMRAAQRLRVKGLTEQYCKEVPGDPEAERRDKRGPRRARYKSVIKKEEPFEPVKYLNVVDALARSMETLDNENEEEQNCRSESLFVDFEPYPVARVDDIRYLENCDIGGEGEDENDEEGEDENGGEEDDGDANQKETITEEDTDEEDEEEEDLENQAEEEFEDQSNEELTERGEDSKDFLPNEDEQFTDSESESDDDFTMDGIEESIELEDVYEYINEHDGEIYNASNEEVKEDKDDCVKIEMTDEEPLSNYVSRLRKQKRCLRRNEFKREAVKANDDNHV